MQVAAGQNLDPLYVVNGRDASVQAYREVDQRLALILGLMRFREGVENSPQGLAGLGQRNFKPKIPGLQWTKGAIGNAEWRGVRVADLLKKEGVQVKKDQVVDFQKKFWDPMVELGL